MSRRFQRMSSTVTTFTPVSARGLSISARACVNAITAGGVSFGKAKSRSATPRVTCEYTMPSSSAFIAISASWNAT